MSRNKLVIGRDIFEDNAFLDGNLCLSNSLAGEELAVDTLNVTVQSRDLEYFPLMDSGGLLLADRGGLLMYARPRSGDLTRYVYGTPAYYYHDGTLAGKFHLSSVARVGVRNYRLSCISAVGLLDNTTHYGGLYTGELLAGVVADIISGTIEYTVASAIADIPLYGWLPIGTRRDNLRQVLFAVGASVRKDPTGAIHITVLDASVKKPIPEDRLFDGGSINYQTPATGAVVTEHSYVALGRDELVTLYEGDVASEAITTPQGAMVAGTLIPFDGPMHDLRIENGSIVESDVNYAVLGPTPDCRLTGQKYSHTMREISLSMGRVAGNDSNVAVSDATLVSLVNSENVAQRVLAYYGSTKLVESDLVVGAERPGDAVSLTDPFGDTTDAIVQSMNITISGLLRASAVFAQGYIPTGIGNYYSHVVVLTSGCTWTVPPECKGKLRAVVIGGGCGGDSGKQGERGGGDLSQLSMQEGGIGGEPGKPGSGGNVCVVTIAAHMGDQFVVAVGSGGLGGISSEAGSGLGSTGGESRLGPYSSSDGRPSESGYTDVIGRGLYAVTGETGIAGGRGSGSQGTGPDVAWNGTAFHAGSNAEDVRSPGSWGQGGAGGGAAAGANGSDGQKGEALRQPDGSYWGEGGGGGAGAKPLARKMAVILGSGGDAGHGGGGGGAGGGASGSGQGYASGGQGGLGGLGGSGGDGAPGCVIIYW